jgi:hypothetical protein
MKKLFNTLATAVLFLAISSGVSAQKIYFCENYTNDGDPIGSGSVWNISPDGGKVYVLYQNGATSINQDKLYLYIDKLADDAYVSMDVKTLTPDKTKSWYVYDCTFYSKGDYKITIKDANYKELAKEFVTIKFKDATTTTTTTTDTDPTESYDYYTYSSVKTGTSINASTGLLDGESESFLIDTQNGSYIIFKVDNDGKEMGSDELIVDIWRKNSKGDYDEFVETKNYTIVSTYDWVYFKYTFYNPGDYKFSIYNKDSNWINTAYVTIKKK